MKFVLSFVPQKGINFRNRFSGNAFFNDTGSFSFLFFCNYKYESYCTPTHIKLVKNITYIAPVKYVLRCLSFYFLNNRYGTCSADIYGLEERCSKIKNLERHC